MQENQPPFEYLVTSSQASLESFELGRLNRSANLSKELRQVLKEWVETEVNARLARWILDCRRAENCVDRTEADRRAASFLSPTAEFSSAPFAESVSLGSGAFSMKSGMDDRTQPDEPTSPKCASFMLRLLEQVANSPAQATSDEVETVDDNTHERRDTVREIFWGDEEIRKEDEGRGKRPVVATALVSVLTVRKR